MYMISEVKFFNGEKKSFPVKGYRPDIIVDDIDKSYRGITFIEFGISDFEIAGLAKIKFTFQNSHYDEVKEGQSFKIMEGPHQVGSGVILLIKSEN